MMTQISKLILSPRQAANRRQAIDRELDLTLFKALSDPTRTQLLACLAKCGRMCSVSEVAECCSVDFSVVSRHLAILARAGVLDAHKHGRTMHYRVRYAAFSRSLRALADAIDQCCPAGTCACNASKCKC